MGGSQGNSLVWGLLKTHNCFCLLPCSSIRISCRLLASWDRPAGSCCSRLGRVTLTLDSRWVGLAAHRGTCLKKPSALHRSTLWGPSSGRRGLC